jgi:hypothetical protein
MDTYTQDRVLTTFHFQDLDSSTIDIHTQLIYIHAFVLYNLPILPILETCITRTSNFMFEESQA